MDFIKGILEPLFPLFRSIGNTFKFARPVFYGCIVLGGAILALLVLVVAIIIASSKKKKSKDKKASEPEIVKEEVQEVKEEKLEQAEPAVAEEIVEEEKVPIVAEETNPLVEEKEPVKEEIQEEKKEEIVEEKKEVEEIKAEEKKAEEKKPAQKKAAPKKEAVKKEVAPKKETAAKKEVAKKEEKPKAAPVAKEEKPKAPAAKKVVGKWIIEKKSEGEYISKLVASNGEEMLSSEIYTSEEGAISGIETIVKAIENDNFSVYQDKNKNYYCKLKSANNRFLCAGEIYDAKDRCLKAIESIKRFAKDAQVQEKIVEGVKYADYVPAPLNVDDVKKGTEGKWRIEKTDDDNYSARLYASNGQLMLATEEVSLIKSAKNAVDSVKKNAKDGNFIIDHDKSGRFYYKLRNAQKSVICIGEAYEKLDSCISAIESVRRFALTAIMIED